MRSHREDRAVNVSADVALVVRLNALPNTPAARKKHGYKGDHKQPCGPGKSWHCESPRLIFRMTLSPRSSRKSVGVSFSPTATLSAG